MPIRGNGRHPVAPDLSHNQNQLYPIGKRQTSSSVKCPRARPIPTLMSLPIPPGFPPLLPRQKSRPQDVSNNVKHLPLQAASSDAQSKPLIPAKQKERSNAKTTSTKVSANGIRQKSVAKIATTEQCTVASQRESLNTSMNNQKHLVKPFPSKAKQRKARQKRKAKPVSNGLCICPSDPTLSQTSGPDSEPNTDVPHHISSTAEAAHVRTRKPYDRGKQREHCAAQCVIADDVPFRSRGPRRAPIAAR